MRTSLRAQILSVWGATAQLRSRCGGPEKRYVRMPGGPALWAAAAPSDHPGYNSTITRNEKPAIRGFELCSDTVPSPRKVREALRRLL